MFQCTNSYYRDLIKIETTTSTLIRPKSTTGEVTIKGDKRLRSTKRDNRTQVFIPTEELTAKESVISVFASPQSIIEDIIGTTILNISNKKEQLFYNGYE